MPASRNAASVLVELRIFRGATRLLSCSVNFAIPREIRDAFLIEVPREFRDASLIGMPLWRCLFNWDAALIAMPL